MDWTMEDHRQALRRIAVVLVALAELAERVAGSPLPVRDFMLWILRRAESVALEFVTTGLQMTGAPAAPIALPQAGDRSAEAMRLALCFRALAAALTGLAAQAGRLADDRVPDRPAGVSAGWASFRRSAAFPSRRASGTNGQHGMLRGAANRPDTS